MWLHRDVPARLPVAFPWIRVPNLPRTLGTPLPTPRKTSDVPRKTSDVPRHGVVWERRNPPQIQAAPLNLPKMDARASGSLPASLTLDSISAFPSASPGYLRLDFDFYSLPGP